MYDIIIIGGGIAGLTAALYARRREMKTLLLTKDIGGQINWAGHIENYPGFDLIGAAELNTRLENQGRRAGYEIKLEEAKKINRLSDGNFQVLTDNDNYDAKTIVFSLGLTPRLLNVEGEKELLGRGLSYCANCDGPFFKGKKVAVIGGGNSALDAAEMMSKIASEVHLIHRRSRFKAFESLITGVLKQSNIKLHFDCEVKKIDGRDQVTGLTIIHNSDNKTESLQVDGVFIEIGHMAQSDLVADLVKRDIHGQIVIDDDCRTDCPGLFAAGDITTTKHKQLSVSAGQGTIAALSAYEYLQYIQNMNN